MDGRIHLYTKGYVVTAKQFKFELPSLEDDPNLYFTSFSRTLLTEKVGIRMVMRISRKLKIQKKLILLLHIKHISFKISFVLFCSFILEEFKSKLLFLQLEITKSNTGLVPLQEINIH